ncbi:NADP-dependent malic enzyme-like isoform X2 [Paramacrobiotus metropolitanus]|nr:NADP-dependent malic enzyme-like isoform X2 [Paramacrobiotus metropolitanus]XP_055334672.1 NADP-dependent malic enzyme-like isoform X2 [Paramacrobiotus metropolitanus]
MVRVGSLLRAISKDHTILGLRNRGVDILRNPRLNKGMAFSLKERQILGIHGLLPPIVLTQDEQVYRTMQSYTRTPTDLDKYSFLSALQDRNEKLFYRLLSENVESMMPIVYTPTVGLACQKFGMVYRRPRGLFITIHDIGHVFEILSNWPEEAVKAIVVTDGERILGLGDLGAFGMGIPIGKLALYTALGGVKPHQCLPICLDVGTDNEALLSNKLYIGLRQKRERGPAYDELIDEFMQAVTARWGPNTLIQFEDFANVNAQRLLDKYQKHYCTFNDDIQGTAGVALAGLLASLRVSGKKMRDHTIFFQGAGSAACGIANFLVLQMMEEGLPEKEAVDRIWMNDADGLIVLDRPAGMSGAKARFAKNLPHMNDFQKSVEMVKPSILIGACATAGVFTEQILRNMAKWNERPVIFALSNPTSKAECTAQEAYTYTEGRALFASGSPFDPVNYNGKIYRPGQGNNAYIFPGVALGAIACGMKHISDKVFLHAARACASMVTAGDLDAGRLYPPLANIRSASFDIAVSTMQEAYDDGTASLDPEPKDKAQFIKSKTYSYHYDSFMPIMYDWPKEAGWEPSDEEFAKFGDLV